MFVHFICFKISNNDNIYYSSIDHRNRRTTVQDILILYKKDSL